MGVSQSVSLTQGTQSIENNTTQVTFKWTSTQSGESWNGYTKTAYYYISINGGAETKYSVSYTLPKGSTTTIASKTFTVTHNSNGTGSVSVRTYMDTGISAGVIQKSTSLTLTTIPRASKIDNFTGTNLAGDFNVTFTSYYSKFTNKLRISIPNVKALETFNYTSGTSFKLSQASLDYLYSYTSNTDKVKLGAVIETWNGSTKIGESSELIHDCYVPGNISPKLGTVTVGSEGITTVDGVSRNILVENKNKVTVSVSGSAPGSGSNIKSYTFSVLSDSTVISTTTTTSTSVSFGPFTKTGVLKFRVVVTDQRGRTADNNGSERTLECYDYTSPYFSAFNAYRANSDGSANTNGTYLKWTCTPKYSSVNSTNSAIIKVNYNGTTSADSLINLGENSATYKVYLTITDNYGGSNKSSTVTVFGSSRILNITKDGTGIALGKMAEKSNLFECKHKAQFDDSVTVPDNGGPVINGYSVGTLGVGAGIESNTDLDSCQTPGVYVVANATIAGSLLNTPISNAAFKLIVEYFSSKNYIKQTVVSRKQSYTSFVRIFDNSANPKWGEWQRVDPNGITKLTIGGDQWYTSETQGFGINMSNSDIINLNALYFQDPSDSAGEAINFSCGGYWDTLYAYDGVLKFHPKRATDTNINGYTVINSNNFRVGTCTLYTNGSGSTINFTGSAMAGVPTIMLTPLTTTGGALPAKVLSRSAAGFTAIIGGDAITAGTAVTFMYLALYY